MLQDLRSCENAAGRAHQQLQEVEFTCGQLHFLLPERDLAGEEIDRQVASRIRLN